MMIGTRLAGRYEIAAEIGHGGMGIVYAAQDPMLDREVAVKMIPPMRMSERAEKRFQREARLVAQMDHPAIVPIYDFGHHAGAFFFVMPLIEGATLRDLVHTGQLRVDEILEVASQVAEGLEYSHARGVIHRDVKPENVMVSREDGELRVRVMDFGLAQDTSGAQLTETDPLKGTIAYMSPEQIKALAVDRRTDIYSLGVLLYESLAGEPPFQGSYASVAYRIVNEPPESLRAQGIPIEDDLERIVLHCLEKEPAARPPSAEHLARSLRRYLREMRRGERAAPMPLPSPHAPPVAAPLVGRESAMREIAARLETAFTGELQTVLIQGDPGTGKSRLLLELESLSRARGLRVLRGRLSDRHGLPLQGLSELVQSGFRVPGAAEAADFSDLAPGLLRLFPALSEVEALREAAGATDARRDNEDEPSDVTFLFELVARSLVRLAGGTPMVVLVENLHAGEVSIGALEYLIRRLAATPTLIAGTFRPAEVERGHPLRRMLDALPDDPRMHLVQLRPFRHDEMRRWLEWLLGTQDVPDVLVSQIFDATEGNPFFGQELVQSLLENGSLGRAPDGTWSLKTGLAGTVLPATIQQAVEDRIENLLPLERAVLETAAVLGRTFNGRDLEDLLEERDDDGLDRAIDALISRKLLVEEPSARGDRLSFASSVVREVLFQSLPRRRRRSLHRRHARALERRYSGRLDRVLPQLVHHFSEGDEAERTVGYAVELGRRALPAFRMDEALQAVRTALEFIDEDEVENGEDLRGELLEIRARAYRGKGQLVRAVKDARAALASYRESGQLERAVQAARLLADVAWQARRVETVEEAVRDGCDLARRCLPGPPAADGARPAAERSAEADTQAAAAARALHRLLNLGAMLATLRGEQDLARRYQDELEVFERRPRASDTDDLPTGGRLVTALVQGVTTLDPARIVTAEEFEVTATIFETLLDSDDEGHVRPGLARTWEPSPDHRTFTLTLRDDLCFSDGHGVDAEAVKRSLERAARHAAVPALAALEGFDAWRRGTLHRDEVAEIRGIRTRGPRQITFELTESLPIFPGLLTNLRTAVVREAGGLLLGTGPFALETPLETPGEGAVASPIVLLRNARSWRTPPPRLDSLEVRTGFDPSAIAAALLRGEIDIGRDLFPEHLEEILRQPSLRGGLVEATRKNVYFVLFNSRTGILDRELRRALAAAIRVRAVVWRTLGRFAQPAESIIPPGIFGHGPCATDRPPGKVPAGRRLRAAVHPIFQERYSGILNALVETWRELGVEVEVPVTRIEDFRDQMERSDGVDLLISRWIADSDDADNFTYELFHSERGLLGDYVADAAADALMVEARRAQEPQRRAELYRRFDELLVREALALPLFHDVDYRVAGPRVRGLRLRSCPPYVNYSELAKLKRRPAAEPWRRLVGGGEIRVPIASRLNSLDPTSGMVADLHEVGSVLYEPLTRVDDGARVVPHLAASVETEDDGRRWRVTLRDGVRFHHGKPLTTDDVRYTFERMLRSAEPAIYSPLLPVAGASDFRAGRSDHLAGLHTFSSRDLMIELERPLEFFPSMLSLQCAAILACEGPDDPTFEAQDGLLGGCWGTGPFRLLGFTRGRHVVLEKNPHYWRADRPRSERLIFELGQSPKRILRGFKSGQLSVAAGLGSAEVEQLLSDPRFAGLYREAPRLGTFFLVPVRQGAFAEAEVRRAFADVLDLERAVLDTVGRWGQPARGIIPPGLLGHEPLPVVRRRQDAAKALRGLRLRAVMLPSYVGAYAALWRRLEDNLRRAGVRVDTKVCSTGELLRRGQEGEVDVLILRWIANYPDVDGFAGLLLHSEEGFLQGIVADPKIDHLLAEGRAERQAAIRHDIYRQIEKRIEEETLLIPIFYEQSYRFFQAGIHGLRFGLTVPEVRYEDLYEEGE